MGLVANITKGRRDHLARVPLQNAGIAPNFDDDIDAM